MHHREQAVVILGMHRGGTSAVAGTAARLGITPPRTLIEASGANPGGYYESYPIVHVNHQLLAEAGGTWDACLGVEPASLDRLVHDGERDTMARTLQQEFGAAPNILLKDPRFCVTLPAWLPVLRANCARLPVLLVLRRPAEVARSLAVRNGVAEDDAAAHWLHHMLAAEYATRALPRGVLFYDDLLRDWRRCITQAGRAAGIVWPNPIAEAAGDIAAFITGSPRPADPAIGIGEAAVSTMIRAAWPCFGMLRDNPLAPHALAYLDHLRAQFAAWRQAR